jgi:chemotaxis protein MotB
MNTLTTRILIAGFIGLAVCWLGWDVLGTPPRAGDGIVLAAFAVGLVWNLFLALTLERQLHWLSKGHTRQRATEILVPPKGLRQLSKILNSKDMSPDEARSALIRLDKYIKHYLLTAARLMPSMVVLVGLACTLAALMSTHVALTQGADLPQLSTKRMMAQFLSYGAMGVVLGFSLWAGTTQLRGIAETTLKKAGQLLQQAGALPDAPAVRQFTTPPLVIIGALFPLALIPIAGIQGYNLYALIVEKAKVASLSQTLAKKETTLQQNVAELQTKLEENTKDSDNLAAELRQQRDTIRKLQADLAKEKKSVTDLTAARKRAEDALKAEQTKAANAARDLATAQATLRQTQAELASETRKVTEANKRLTDAQKEQERLTASLREAETTLTRTRDAAATREAELDGRIAKLQDDTARLNTLLTEARAAQASAERARDVLLQRVRIARPDTRNLHPAVKAMPDGRLVVPADVLFDGKSTRMTSIAEGVLTEIATRVSAVLAQATPNAVLVIGTHTDLTSTGGGDNNALTAAQANQLADIFASKGITRRRMVPVGYGHHQERDARLTDEAFANNRRVEFYVLPHLIVDVTNLD